MRISQKRLRRWEQEAEAKGRRIKGFKLMEDLTKCNHEDAADLLTEFFMMNNPYWNRGERR